ncbi:hypothetical protein NESM_000241900 [Novymonas esmeraldas]|uniref:Uncharacterized protein n=1 Tax=Novymonas esmeraldas TaxID=1808958 RepID=A0AAW0F6U5_9TRYP
MQLWRLHLLTARAVCCLHLYDPTEASVAVAALGELGGELSGSSSRLLLGVLPSLPHYDATQLTRAFGGLSKLRVGHHMVTAHFLQLFLAATVGGRCGASAHSGRQLPPPLADQLSAVAAMASLLQRHHTQRTVRAFLAAAERALAPFAAAASGDVVKRLSRHMTRGTTDVSDSATLAARQSAAQALFLLEVHVHARVSVAAPQTPSWLLHALMSVPWTSYTFASLLHLYHRLHPATAVPRQRCRVTGECAATVVLSSLAAHVLHRAEEVLCSGHVAADESVPLRRPSRVEATAEGHADVGGRAGLSPAQQYVIVRCAASSLSRSPSMAELQPCVVRLLRGVPVEVFYELSAEFGCHMRGSALMCWVAHMPRSTAPSTGAVTTAQGCRVQHHRGTAGDAARGCAALLQLLYVQYAASPEPSPRTEVATSNTAVRAVCRRLVVCLAEVTAAVATTPVEEGSEREWELLALLLDMLASPARHSDSDGVPFVLWLVEDGEAMGTAPRTRHDLGAALVAARDALVMRWLHLWAGCCCCGGGAAVLRSPATVGGSADNCATALSARCHVGSGVARPPRALSDKVLRLHWAIAHQTEEQLRCDDTGDDSGAMAWRTGLAEALTTYPPAHPTDAVWPTVWRALISESEARLHATARRRRACDAVLEADLLVILAEALLHASRAAPPSRPSLADSICESGLPEALCTALEWAGQDDAVALSAGPLSRAEAELLLRTRWRRRLWWAERTAAPGAFTVLRAAQTVLLHTVFMSKRGPTRDCLAFRVAPCGGSVRWWPHRLLVASLRGDLSRGRLCATTEEEEEEDEEEGLPTPAAECDRVRSLARECGGGLAAGDAVLHDDYGCDNDDHHHDHQRPPLQGQTPQHRLRLQGEDGEMAEGALVPLASASLFHRATGLSSAMMSSVESFVNRVYHGHRAATATLCVGSLRKRHPPPGVSVEEAALYREWYMEDTLVTLSADVRAAPSPHVNIGAARVARVCGGIQTTSAATCDPSAVRWLPETLALLLTASMTLQAIPAAPSATRASASSFHYYAAPPLSSAPSHAAVAAEAVCVGLCFSLAELSQRLAAALLAGSMGDHASEAVAEAEALVVAGAAEWVRLERLVRHAASTAATSSRPVPALATGEPIADEVLLPLVWRGVHRTAPCRGRRIASLPPLLRDGGDQRGCTLVVDVWRLQLFARHLCRHLPLARRFAPAQERLWRCLRAAAAAASASPPVAHQLAEEHRDDSGEASLDSAMAELAAELHERHWYDGVAAGTHHPLRFLKGLLSALTASLNHATDEETVDGAAAAATPADDYASQLLPCHPFALDRAAAAAPQCTGGVRLVVVTWMHVLLLCSIAEHHPRLLSHTGMQRLHSALQNTHMRARDIAGSAVDPHPGARLSESVHGPLLEACLACELGAAVAELLKWPCCDGTVRLRRGDER